MNEPDTTELSVQLLRESEKAFLVKLEDGREEWFPKSQVNFDRLNHKTMKGNLVVPDWLIEKKEL